MAEFYHNINQELKLVETTVRDNLIINGAGTVCSFAHLEFSHLDNIIRPAVAILSGKLFNYQREQVVAIASITQFIFMASRIHGNISEIDPPVDKVIDPRDGCQFPVLVGDYLYGKFFMELSRVNILKYLGPLADIICQIHEGSVLEQLHSKICIKSSPDILHAIVRKQTAELFAGCSSIAAGICGAQEEDKKHMYNFGLYLGCGFGLLQRGYSVKHAEEYFDKAIKSLYNFADGSARQELILLIEELRREKIISQRMVG